MTPHLDIFMSVKKLGLNGVYCTHSDIAMLATYKDS